MYAVFIYLIAVVHTAFHTMLFMFDPFGISEDPEGVEHEITIGEAGGVTIGVTRFRTLVYSAFQEKYKPLKSKTMQP